MKKLFFLLIPIIVLAIVLIVTNRRADPIENRIWVGKLYRTSDNNKLSDVCLKITNDSLLIYSNAIFGSDNELLVYQSKKKNNYVFKSEAGRQFNMTFSYSQDNETKEEILSIIGPDYNIYLTPISDDNFSQEILNFYLPVPAPPTAELCFSGRWSGEIVRTRDDQKLSPVCIEYGENMIQIYANAIFGKNNENLTYTGFFDGEFHYTNNADELFTMHPIPQDGHIIMESDDFKMILFQQYGNWEEACSFYKGMEVPRNADSYLFGSYSGKSIIRFPQADLMGLLFGLEQGFSDFQMTVSFVFIEDNQCRITTEIKALSSGMQMMALLGGSTGSEKDVEVKKYKVIGNKLIFGKNDEWTIRPDGSFYLSCDELAQKTKGKCVADDLILKRL